MSIDEFHKLYLTELQEFRSVEAQMTDELGRLADRASHAALADAIRAHREATETHRERIDAILESHDANASAHTDSSMKAIVKETEKWAGMVENGSLRDAGLISSLQRMEHYEIAVLGTLASWAKTLGHDDDAATLAEILDIDKGVDEEFTRLAKEVVNPAAA